MDADRIKSFRESLDRSYAWPSLYTFKFIVPTGKEDEVKKLFPRHSPSEKHSQNGKYTSVTIQMMMPSSDAVIKVYQMAGQIDGLIPL